MRVLIVDDEEDIAFVIGSLLEDMGMVCDYAHTGEAGLTMLAEQKFNAILLDYTLPDMTGLDMLKRLRELGDNTPTLLFTGHDTPEIMAEALSAGAQGVLHKPVSAKIICERLQALAGFLIQSATTKTYKPPFQ